MLKKIPYDTAAPILSRFALSGDVPAEALATKTPMEAIEALRAMGVLVDLVQFVAHALPAREGVAWALACQTDVLSPRTELQREIAAWVRDPQEARRLVLLSRLDEIGTDTPAGWLCAAVVWCGAGSIVAPSNPPVFPPEFLHAKALLGAVALLALSRGPAEDPPDHVALIDAVAIRACEVANGGWPVPEGT
jgi:hypothetical protein